MREADFEIGVVVENTKVPERGRGRIVARGSHEANGPARFWQARFTTTAALFSKGSPRGLTL